MLSLRAELYHSFLVAAKSARISVNSCIALNSDPGRSRRDIFDTYRLAGGCVTGSSSAKVGGITGAVAELDKTAGPISMT